MSLIRPDFWIPHLSVYAFGVIQHQPQDNPEITIHTVAPLDYVVAILITAGLFAFQVALSSKILHSGRKWYLMKSMKAIDPMERLQANRTLLGLLTGGVLGLLTVISCALLCANFMMRIWALGFILRPDQVRYGGGQNENRINCSFGDPHCISLKPNFGVAVENLEQAAAFFMLAVLSMASGLLVHRAANLFKRRVWLLVMMGVAILVFLVSTIAGIVAVYRNPYDNPRQAGWLYYRYQASDSLTHVQIAIARITPTISTVALVALNIVFSASVIFERVRVRRESCTASVISLSALPSAIVGITLLFIPAYGAGASHPFFYMRLARYSLRTLWAAFLVVTPQITVLKSMHFELKNEQSADEKTVIDLDTNSVKCV